MTHYPPAIKRLIDAFSRLPGIGPKTAARLVFFLMEDKRGLAREFQQALSGLSSDIVRCNACLNFAQSDPCDICSDTKRDQNVVCIVATPQDMEAIERAQDFRGVYHILGGVLVPTEGITPEKLNIKQLEERIKKNGVQEIIIALNPDLEGETTTLFLKKLLSPFGVRLTRLARGLPTGSDIEYADEMTLRSAIEGRKEI